MTQKKKIKKTYYTRRNTAFDYFNIVLQALLALTILIPFLHLLVISVSSPSYATRSGLHLWPDTLDFSTYKRVLSSRYIWTGYRATLIRTVLGTVIQLFMTSMGAYVLSKRYFPHRTFWTMCIVFTMYFSGGLIPSYLLMGNLHLMNPYASMILPGLVGTYNMILIRNYFQSIPQDLEDACMIDGAGQFTTFYKIIIPVSTPILATVALWLAVGHWNSWFSAFLYLSDDKKYPLQMMLRRILVMNQIKASDYVDEETLVAMEGMADLLKYSLIVVATVPILCAYPFIQKYFVKGIMIGSLKG